MSSPFLTAQWRSLVMLNYEIDPAILKPFVPWGTELDEWNGKTFVSIVGFMFLDTRVIGVPIPFHINFEEVNLRFYVRRKSEEGWRRGVTFLREIVPRPATALVANIVYNERYLACPMRHCIDLASENGNTQDGSAEYSWRFRGGWNHLRVETTGEWAELEDGSHEEFITEHYWGYAAQRNGGCMEYRVEHPRWRVLQTTRAEFDCDIEGIYGTEYVASLSATPASAFVAEGSKVTVYRGVRL